MQISKIEGGECMTDKELDKELNDLLKEEVEDMEDDNIVNEIAYYLYER